MARSQRGRRRKCLHCDNTKFSRGCCRKCLDIGHASGKTDHQLVTEGWFLPMEKTGRPPKRRRKLTKAS